MVQEVVGILCSTSVTFNKCKLYKCFNYYLLSAHWYLAVICYPELRHPVYRKDPPVSNGVDPVKKEESTPTPPAATTPSPTQTPTPTPQPPTEDKQEPGEATSTAPEEKENAEMTEVVF